MAEQGAVDDTRGAFVAFAVCAVPLARALVVPPLTLLANSCRGKKRSLSRRETAFLVFVGLRGAIAFALAKSVSSAHRRTIVAATSAVVIFTTVVLGGLTRAMLLALGMIAADGAPRPSGHAKRPSDGGSLARRWHSFDARVLQPLFGGPGVKARLAARPGVADDAGEEGTREEAVEMMSPGNEDEASS